MIPKSTWGHPTVDIISYATGVCALGNALVARSVSGVCAILIGEADDELVTDLAARFPTAKLIANEAVVQDDLVKVIRFVDKPSAGLELPLDLRGTPFQRRVWEKLRAITLGTTVTYTELARWLDGHEHAHWWHRAAQGPVRSETAPANDTQRRFAVVAEYPRRVFPRRHTADANAAHSVSLAYVFSL
jgi:AraC family transcriptional regulator, regulatory protein of adaptative response / methylated-DNA-[protein]-cysteine methyltransferase